MLGSTVEVFREQRARWPPAEALELGGPVGAQLVRCHRPARQRPQQLVDDGEDRDVSRVVVGEVVVHRDAQAVALVGEQRTEAYVIRREPETEVRLDQGAVGVDQGAVEVEDHPRVGAHADVRGDAG